MTPQHGKNGWELVIYDSAPDRNDPDIDHIVCECDSAIAEIFVYERARFGEEPEQQLVVKLKH